jgi:hypothetical protein
MRDVVEVRRRMGSLEVNEEEILGGGCRVTRRKRVEKEVGRGGRVWRKKEERRASSLYEQHSMSEPLPWLLDSFCDICVTLHCDLEGWFQCFGEFATSILKVEYSR